MFDKLIELVKQFGRLFLFWEVVPAYDGGVIMRLGKFHRLTKEGWNWIWPFLIEVVITTNVVTETMLVGPQSLLTGDGKQVVITTVITFNKDDVKTFILDINGGDRVIDDAAPGVIAELIMQHSFDQLLDMDIGNELSKMMRRFAKRYGVNIQRVQIVDFSTIRSLRLLQSVTQSYTPHKEF